MKSTNNQDVKQLFIGKELAATITRSDGNLTIKIKTAALTPALENELRAFVEQLWEHK